MHRLTISMLQFWPMDILSSSIGSPRIGPQRELKRALESYWAGKSSWGELRKQANRIESQGLLSQKEAGLDLIPAGDFCLYDQMLDASVMYGLIPKRFKKIKSLYPDTYFGMARGNRESEASEMTKWFDTNYHYLVPEIDQKPRLSRNLVLSAADRAKKTLDPSSTKLTLLGPLTILGLAKGYTQGQFAGLVQSLGRAMAQAVKETCEKHPGLGMIQIEEPALVMDRFGKKELKVLEKIYIQIQEASGDVPILLQSYFGYPAHLDWYLSQPFDGFGLDFVREPEIMAKLKNKKFPKNKILAAGIVDGRNVWKADLVKAHETLEKIIDATNPSQFIVQPSSSLMFLPYSLAAEKSLDPEIKSWLAFGRDRLDEVVLLARALREGGSALAADLKKSQVVRKKAATSSKRHRPTVQKRIKSLRAKDFRRKSSLAARLKMQAKKLNLPIYPTTTIGSFPQTPELRILRAAFRGGRIQKQEYQRGIEARIAHCVGVQEALDIDVLVHGEFERTDMVEYFGQKLEGFSFTLSGWVQSYGSRCVRPPIVHGDVERTEPMTIEDAKFAQGLTKRPMKGMLTGPVTILNWSFVRDDIARKDVAFQIGLAIRDETVGLETAGLPMIQIDEPALREGLPLKKAKEKEYLTWSVEAFRLSASGVRDSTQIHTHMCYGEFQDVIKAIRGMDADVISVEASRSKGEAIETFGKGRYSGEVGPGAYDIHSPRIPTTAEMLKTLRACLRQLKPSQLWVNPDCGLKTRKYHEVLPSLRNMVAAAKLLRAEMPRGSKPKSRR